ncbi:hypothetical protein [Streptomyces brasiliscabiei]|uniref:hypothetical protein n=1 Tax=Streptomyces brasiliscabiei TaxID=2736302 RepID=UPI001C117ACA|nr:hypothetical protein [Streptomyces brasiliscabiei]
MNNGLGGIVGLILFGLLCWWGYSIFFAPDYSKPWWTGTKNLRVCDADGLKCYTLPVTSNGEEVTRVSFRNGGYITPVDASCAKAASDYDFDQFCIVVDGDGKEWDILP